MKKSNLFVGGGIADFALSARVVIGYFKSIKSNNIFYTGIDLPIMDNKWKNSSISTISSNIFSFLGIPSVTSFKNFNNLIEMKFFNKNIYKKFFILSNFSFKKKNIEFLDCSLNNNKKKKIILFIDKDDISDWCKVKKNYKNYLKTKEKVLEIISNNFKTKYDLIYKPHPRQNKIEQNIFDFKIKYKNLYLENLLKFKKDKIFMTIGIVSLGLKISNLYGIKTMSIKNLLLKNHIWTNKRLDLNSKIINLNSLDMLTKNIKSDSKNKIKVITECYYS